MVLVGLFSGSQGPVMQFARIIGAAADLSESTADVAVLALNATSMLAVGASNFVLQAAANGFTTGANLWKGIDFQDINAQRCHGQVLVAGPDTLEYWLNSSQAQTLIPCLSPHLSSQLIAAAQSIAGPLPMTQTAVDELNITGSFWSTNV